jgi:hypothetical protein
MSSITGMLPSSVQVLRDGIEKEVAAQDLVLGDIVSDLFCGFQFPLLKQPLCTADFPGAHPTGAKDSCRCAIRLRVVRFQGGSIDTDRRKLTYHWSDRKYRSQFP